MPFLELQIVGWYSVDKIAMADKFANGYKIASEFLTVQGKIIKNVKICE